jgi:hypothetical protein
MSRRIRRMLKSTLGKTNEVLAEELNDDDEDDANITGLKEEERG